MATVLPPDFSSSRGNSVPQAGLTGWVESPGNQLGSSSPLAFLLSCQRGESVLLELERFLGRQRACAEGTGFKGLPKVLEAPFLVLPRRKENSPLVKGRGSLGSLRVIRKPAHEMLFRASEKKKSKYQMLAAVAWSSLHPPCSFSGHLQLSTSPYPDLKKKNLDQRV